MRARQGGNTQGEYAAIAVYDELLDEFDKEDASSCGDSSAQSELESDEEEFSGSTMKRWSDSKNRRGNNARIEMIPFDDGHLNLKEING